MIIVRAGGSSLCTSSNLPRARPVLSAEGPKPCVSLDLPYCPGVLGAFGNVQSMHHHELLPLNVLSQAVSGPVLSIFSTSLPSQFDLPAPREPLSMYTTWSLAPAVAFVGSVGGQAVADVSAGPDLLLDLGFHPFACLHWHGSLP